MAAPISGPYENSMDGTSTSWPAGLGYRRPLSRSGRREHVQFQFNGYRNYTNLVWSSTRPSSLCGKIGNRCLWILLRNCPISAIQHTGTFELVCPPGIPHSFWLWLWRNPTWIGVLRRDCLGWSGILSEWIGSGYGAKRKFVICRTGLDSR